MNLKRLKDKPKRIEFLLKTCPQKQYRKLEPKEEGQYTPPRPLMFSRLMGEVKKEFAKKYLELPRRERRIRMIRLARRTMKMLRNESIGGKSNGEHSESVAR